MLNILINGLNLKVGGGKSILDNLLSTLQSEKIEHNYHVLTPNWRDYLRYECNKVSILRPPKWASKTYAFPFVFHRLIPLTIKEHCIDVIFNFGDIVVPVKTPQLYLFDWPYAVYPESIVWERMNFSQTVVKRIKLSFFKSNIKYATHVIAQTNTMKNRLQKYYGLKNVDIIPLPVVHQAMSKIGTKDFKLPYQKHKFLYLTHYYPHKNLEILIPLATHIKKKSINCVFVITVDPGESIDGDRLLSQIRNEQLENIIINLGSVPLNEIGNLYEQVDTLFMPTLLETFGMPYVEAMHNGKPILTSDIDFAHDICQNAALYFDPLDVISISDVITQHIDTASGKGLVNAGKKVYSLLPDWPSVVCEYEGLLSSIANNKDYQ